MKQGLFVNKLSHPMVHETRFICEQVVSSYGS